jgi:pimeloyl-ACP methyl ester carboxylesterase
MATAPVWTDVQGYATPVWVCGDPNAPLAVITSHGLTNDHRDAPLFDEFRNVIATTRDVALVEFDYPGSGDADGEFRDKRLALLRAALVAVAQLVRREFGPDTRVAIVGRSVGGTVALASYPEVRPVSVVVMSPPYRLVENLGNLRERPASDGSYPLPSWAQPSGQIKGVPALSREFFDELPNEERRLHAAVASASRVLLIASTEDPKVPAAELESLWRALAADPSNSREVFHTDHNYSSVRKAVVRRLRRWLNDVAKSTHFR